MSQAQTHRLAVHGLAVQLTCEIPGLFAQIEHDLGQFEVPDWPEGFTPAVGWVRPYEQAEVLRYLSPTARRIACTAKHLEIYEERERFWVIDERWGLSEINLLKSQWRTWLLPQCAVNRARAVQFAVHWPMAQLLRARGLFLTPAAAVSRGGISSLILCPFSIEPELVALIQAGYRIIGQSWTALREENGRIELLHLPGQVERPVAPRLRGSVGEQNATWVDLMESHCGSEQRYGFCNAVLIVEPGRRPKAGMLRLEPAHAMQVLKSAWPIAELHPQRGAQVPVRLAQECLCFELTLSRQPEDLLKLMTELTSFGAPSGEISRRAAVA